MTKSLTNVTISETISKRNLWIIIQSQNLGQFAEGGNRGVGKKSRSVVYQQCISCINCVSAVYQWCISGVSAVYQKCISVSTTEFGNDSDLLLKTGFTSSKIFDAEKQECCETAEWSPRGSVKYCKSL